MDDRTGGPAFPTANPHHPQPSDGMSLRAWFAGQALAGMLARDIWSVLDCKTGTIERVEFDAVAAENRGRIAECAVAYADALIAKLAEVKE